MDLAGKQVFVTGGEGFIGSHLVEALVEAQAKVRVLRHYRGTPIENNLQYAPQKVQQAVEVVSGDVRDPFAMQGFVNDVDVVFHLAALIGIPYSYVAPASYVQTNVQGTHHLLQAALHSSVQRFIHTSTSEVYGSAQYTPMDEKHPQVGQSPYSASKIGGDKLAESYHLSFGLGVVTVRPFNAYGPRQSERAVIPTIAAQLLHSAKKVRLGDLTTVRDFTFVKDIASGFLEAARCDQAVGKTVNLGYGKGITIGDLAQRLIDLSGEGGEIISEKNRVRPESSEVRQLICDNTLAGELLKWQPQTALDEGLQQVLEFVRSHQQRFEPGKYHR